MALIDNNALREYYKMNERCEECHWNNRDCSKPPYYSLLDICKAIDEVPIVDAIPVEWLRKWPKSLREGAYVRDILTDWQKEQEAR